MAHLIENLDVTFSTLGTEWHGLANHLPDGITRESEVNGRKVSDALFQIVSGSPSATVLNADGTPFLDENGQTVNIALPGHKIIMADCTQRLDILPHERTFVPLHVPKDSYYPIENGAVYDMVMTAIAGTGAKITTLGTLDNLKKFYISIDIGGEDIRHPNGDKFNAFLNFMTSHDGTLALEIKDSFIRVVCHNTFSASRNHYGNAVIIPHTKSAEWKIPDLAETFNGILAGRKKTMEILSELAEMPVKTAYEGAYAATAFLAGMGRKSAKKPDEISTQTYNVATEVQRLSVIGMGNSGKSRYDIYNGGTEYWTHSAGGKNANRATRWSAANYGQASDYKTEFMDFLMAPDYEENLEFGEKLYKEKSLVSMAG